MAIHPKISAVGLAFGVTVGFGLALFMLGRMTVSNSLPTMLLGVGVGIGILSAVGFAMLRHLPASKYMEGVMLHHEQSSGDGFVSAVARSDLVGKAGIATSELRPAGMAEIEGERVSVITEGDWIAAGTPLTVLRAEAMGLVVRRAPQLKA